MLALIHLFESIVPEKSAYDGYFLLIQAYWRNQALFTQVQQNLFFLEFAKN